MIATGLPRRVITTVSPLSAAFKIREKPGWPPEPSPSALDQTNVVVCTTLANGRAAVNKAAAVLRNGWQHHLAHHAGRRNPLVFCIVIAGGDRHDQIETGQYKEPLTAIADGNSRSVEARAIPARSRRCDEGEFTKYQW